MEFSLKRCWGLFLVSVLCGVVGTSTLHAQEPIFSFEEGLAPWNAVDGTIAQSEFGATHGSYALLMDNITSTYKNNIANTANFGPTTPGMEEAYRAFNLAANVIANGGSPKLEFDFTWDFAQVTTSNWIQFGMVINSVAGWKEYNVGQFIVGNADNTAPNPLSLGTVAADDGVTFTSLSPNSAHLAIPLGEGKMFNFVPDSTWYYMQFKSNGGWEGTVDFAVDNIRFTGVPVFEEHTLFSWETPDNPATPEVNEQLEGWRPNPGVTPATQNLSITTTGATHGNSAMQLDRTPLPEGFTWGSVYGLDAAANPSDQAKIDDLVERINGATQIAIDITFQDDLQIASPTYSNLWLAFTDDTGARYQAGSPGFDVVEAANRTTQTLIWNLSSFEDFNSDKILSVDGLAVGTQQLAIVLGTATDGGAIYQLDNFRLISEVSDSLPGDFNKDGSVDGRDFLVWQRNPGVGDLADWQTNYGTGTLVAAIAVPEPAALTVALLAGLAALSRRRVC
jgi:hypothetical protein